MKYAKYQPKPKHPGGEPRVHAVPVGGEQVTLCNIHFKDGGWRKVLVLPVTCKKCLTALRKWEALSMTCPSCKGRLTIMKWNEKSDIVTCPVSSCLNWHRPLRTIVKE